MKKFSEVNATNQQSGAPIEPPPSYDEAIQNPPFTSHLAPSPSAPALETNNAQYFYGSNVPGHIPLPGALNDGRFEAWNDRATRALITNRLEMNDQFVNARTSEDKNVLWKQILNHLADVGYYFSLSDLLHYWELQLYIYRNLLHVISSGNSSAHWEYFEPMHNAFKYDSSVDALSSISTYSPLGLSSTSNAPNAIIPAPTRTSAPESNQILNNSGANIPLEPINQDNVRYSSNVPFTTDISSPNTQQVSNLKEIRTQENIIEINPVLNSIGQIQNDRNINLSSAPTSSAVESSIVSPVTQSRLVQSSSVGEVTTGVGDLTSIRESLPVTNIVPNQVDFSDVSLKLGTITTQPEVYSVPKIGTDDVIMMQPTFSAAAVPAATSTDYNSCADCDCCADDGCCDGEACCDADGCSADFDCGDC